jgi:hypothetical protein
MNRQSAAATATCNRNTHTNRQQLDVQHPPVHHICKGLDRVYGSKWWCMENSTALHVDAMLMGRCGHINMSGIIPVCAHQHMNKYVTFKKDCTACARREGCMQMARIPGLFDSRMYVGAISKNVMKGRRASDRVSGCTPCTVRRVGVAKWALLCPLLWVF